MGYDAIALTYTYVIPNSCIILISLDGCLPESTTVQSTILIMWPEVAITDVVSVECPCGTVSYN